MTNFATAFLENVQAQLRAEIQQKKLQLADVNEALLKLGGEPDVTAPTGNEPIVEIAPPTFTESDLEELVAHEAVAASSYDGPTEPFHPDGDRAARGDDDTPPWDQQEQSDAPAEPTSGRRTYEQIAAEHGVDLKDVKAFAEKQGVKRVTKGLIEEYATVVRSGGAPGGGGAQPSTDEALPPLPEGGSPGEVAQASEPDASDFEDGDASAEVYEPPF